MQSYEYNTMRSVEDSYWWYIGLRTRVVESVKSVFDIKNSLRIFDAGCGTGGMMSFLRSHIPSADIVGMDFSSQAVRTTQERNTGQVVNASVERVPFHSEIFDVIISLDVLETKGVDDHRALLEFNRVLKSGGVLILNLTAFECLKGQHDAAVHVGKRYTQKKLRLLLHNAGFLIVNMTYWNAMFFPLLFIWRPLSRLFANTSQPVSDLRPLPSLINKTLTWLALKELKLSRHRALPFGSSIFAIAKKK
jgi:ubiquinone/menaquinone biosynthesis C-methylase UbiE